MHLPPDLRSLYSAASLAYYLGASIVIDDAPFIDLGSCERIMLPSMPDFETWMGEALRRTFYLDCAVRYAALSGGSLNCMDVKELFGRPADDIFYMGPGERFLLYNSRNVPKPPSWHMAAYLDPVPESVEALPFLLHRLSAIYAPRSVPMNERGLVSISVHDYLGRRTMPELPEGAGQRSVLLPALRDAGSHLWFSDGFAVDATKASARALANGRKYDKKKDVRVGIVCNEASMSGEVDAIIEALSRSSASLQVYWDADISRLADVFARGFDIVQLIGHCDDRGFKCRDGFARVSDIEENRTPMFFFNSCSSFREAAALVERGSVCGVATLFRVLEEAALDVCRNFYLMLGEGYPAGVAIDAAKECSALGKEYLLIGDGAYTCFEGDELKPLYRIARRNDEYTLGCTMGNVHKGHVVGTWSSEGKRMVSDLGYETGFMSAGHLARVSGKFEGFCLYDHNIYTSVRDAALKVVEDSRAPKRYRR